MTLLLHLLTCICFALHTSQSWAQLTQYFIRGVPQSRASNFDSNAVKHGPPKLNPSVSFGIKESDIAAIFRGVAYGVTSSYAKTSPKTKTPSTTTTPLTSTTTEATTTTTVKPTTLSGIDIQNDIDDRFSDDFSSSISSNVWKEISSDISQEKVHQEENNSIDAPSASDPQLYIPQRDTHNNSQKDESANAENNYESCESLHSRAGYHDKYLSIDSGHVQVNDVEIHQVVDYAWVIHVYLTGVLMGVVAAMAICCISRIHFCSLIFPRNFFVTMHVLVFLAAFLRFILLFNGSFGEAHSKLPKVLTGLLINSVPPCLTAAFALLLLVFLKATHLYILPMKYQSFVLAVISIVHIVTSVVVDICAGLSDSESVINALRAGVQAVTAGWGILLTLAFIVLITHLWKNEEQRSVIPEKSLQVIYVAVVVQRILACFTIYGIVTPRVTSKDADNTWSLWVVASCERLLEACFCVTLLVITTTFTLSKCNNAKPQEQKAFSVMMSGKRDVTLGRSANVYPVTCDKGGFLPGTLITNNLNNDGSTKSEHDYSEWLDIYTGTIDSTTDFQLFDGKATSTMSTVHYPPYNVIAGTTDSMDDTVKDSYLISGPESSATSYSTLSSHRQANPHLCYCSPVTACYPTQASKAFPALTKLPVPNVPQYSNPQVAVSSPLKSEESTSGSSYYGSSLGSSHIYSSPQYYTCPAQNGQVAEIHNINNQGLPLHLHQCKTSSPREVSPRNRGVSKKRLRRQIASSSDEEKRSPREISPRGRGVFKKRPRELMESLNDEEKRSPREVSTRGRGVSKKRLRRRIASSSDEENDEWRRDFFITPVKKFLAAPSTCRDSPKLMELDVSPKAVTPRSKTGRRCLLEY